MRRWNFQEDIKHYFSEIVLRSKRSAYPRMTTHAQLKCKYPKTVNDTDNTLAELQPDFAFAMTQEQRRIERGKRMNLVFGGNHGHAVFDDEDEFDFEEYRAEIYG